MPTDFNYSGKFIHISEDYLKIQELNLVQMALLTTIKGLKKQDSVCYASNVYLAQFLHVSANTIDNNLKKLEDRGYIKRVNPKSRNRRIVVLESSLDRYLRDEYDHKNCSDTENVTNIGLIENDMTTNIVIDEHKNCDDRPQKLGAINIIDSDSDNISNRSEFCDSNNTIDGQHESPDIYDNPKWDKFRINALEMQGTVSFLRYIRDKYGSDMVKVSQAELRSAIKSGIDHALILYAATLVYNESGRLTSTIESLNNSDTQIPDDIQTTADRIVGQILAEAERNFKKGGMLNAIDI